MKTFTINETGLNSIKTQINELGLDWSIEGTAQEIWMCANFDDSLNDTGYFDFEAGRGPTGHIQSINITLDDVDAHEVE